MLLQMSTGPQQRKYRYKNVGLDSQELRRRREEEGVQLRKQKREQQLSKRRNVPNVATDDEGVSITEDFADPTPVMVIISGVIIALAQRSVGGDF